VLQKTISYSFVQGSVMLAEVEEMPSASASPYTAESKLCKISNHQKHSNHIDLVLNSGRGKDTAST
jgi:hypothetical protein